MIVNYPENRIKELRKKSSLTQQDLSKLLKTEDISATRVTIARYEAGNRTPKESVWKALAEIFKVPVSYVKGEDKMKVSYLDNRLKKYREEKGLTLLELAELLSSRGYPVAPDTVRKYETNERIAKEEYYVAVSEILNISVKQLKGLTGNKELLANNVSKTTKDVLLTLIDRTYSKKGNYGALEVTLGYGKIGYERCDYVEYQTDGQFTCYEVKVTYSDFKSKARQTYLGNRNYLVTTKEVYEKIQNHHDTTGGVGILIYDNGKLELAKKCSQHNINFAKKIELMEGMMKASCRDFAKSIRG